LTLNTALAVAAAVDDPTLAIFAATGPSSAGQQPRGLVSPTGVLNDFEKLGTHEGEENLPGYLQSSAGGRLPFTAGGGGFAPYVTLDTSAVAAVAGRDPAAAAPCLIRGSVIAQAGGGQLSAGLQAAAAANASSLAVPLLGDTSITTPLGGSDDDDNEEDKSMMTAIRVGPAVTLRESPSEGLFDTYDLKGGGPATTTAGDPLMLLTTRPPARFPPRSLIPGGGGGSTIKQEVDNTMDTMFPSPEDSNSTTEEATMRELLDEKDRMDIASFISEYNNEIYAQSCGDSSNKGRSTVSSMETEDEMTKIFIRVKEEPMSAAAAQSSSPGAAAAATVYSLGSSGAAAAMGESPDEEDAKHVLVAFDDDLVDQPLPISSQQPQERAAETPVNPGPTANYICTATVLTTQSPLTANMAGAAAAVTPRPIFIRKQSQDSLTRTKNPVLPNIHAELLPLVVPEPRQARYQHQPTAEPPFSLDDFDAEEVSGVATAVAAVTSPSPTPPSLLPQQQQPPPQLTELKGSLFLSDDYSQSYFQPWN
jgi:hypothetical protein